MRIDAAGTPSVLSVATDSATSSGGPHTKQSVPCGSCSTCTPGAIDGFERDLVRKILAGIARAGERYGHHRIISMLAGDTHDLPPRLANLSTTGILRHESRDSLQEWIQAAIAAGLVMVSSDEYRSLSLTPDGRRFMRGEADARIARPLPAYSRLAMERLIDRARYARTDDDWDDEPNDEDATADLMPFGRRRRRSGRW